MDIVNLDEEASQVSVPEMHDSDKGEAITSQIYNRAVPLAYRSGSIPPDLRVSNSQPAYPGMEVETLQSQKLRRVLN